MISSNNAASAHPVPISSVAELSKFCSLPAGVTSLVEFISQLCTNMMSLQVLDITGACGICGILPVFCQAATQLATSLRTVPCWLQAQHRLWGPYHSRGPT